MRAVGGTTKGAVKATLYVMEVLPNALQVGKTRVAMKHRKYAGTLKSTVCASNVWTTGKRPTLGVKSPK